MKSAVWALGDGQAVRLTWVASSHRGPPTIYLPSWSERRHLASTGRSWGLHWRCAWVCLNDNVELLWGTGLDSRSTALAWVWFCFLMLFGCVLPVSVQNVVGLMWWSTVLILRCIFSHSLYALWLSFEKGWNGSSTSPWCSIWFLLSIWCLSIVRHHCTARKLQSEDANAQVPDHADTEDADMPRLVTIYPAPCRRSLDSFVMLCVYFYTECTVVLYMILYDSMLPCICACFGSRWKVEENIPTLAEISQYILPGHFLLVLCPAMLSGCCGVSTVCKKGFPTWAANICKR